MLTIFAAHVKFVLFSSKSAAQTDRLPLMLSWTQPLIHVQVLQLAGCKLENNVLCFYTSFAEKLLYFSNSKQSWVIKLYRRIFLYQPHYDSVALVRCLIKVKKKKCCHICASTTLWGFSALIHTVCIHDQKSPSLKPQMPRRVSTAHERRSCVGTVMHRALAKDWLFCLSRR